MPSSSRTARSVAAIAGRLVGGHAGDRLVEQQQGRLGAQGAAELDALALAVGEVAHGPVELPSRSEQLGDLARPALGWSACSRARRRQPQPGGRGTRRG